MMLFALIAVLLAAASVGALVWPFLADRKSDPAGRAAFDLAVHRDQLDEIERDVARGLLDTAEAEAARIEIRRRALAVADADAAEAPLGTTTPRWIALILLTVLVPVGAFGTYLAVGTPGMSDQPLAERTLDAPADDEHLIAQLARRLEQAPDNVDGWLLLARAYGNRQRYTEAAQAYARAVAAGANSPVVRAEYAEILVMAADGTVPDKAAELFRSVVAEAPTEPRSRYFLGLYKIQHDDAKGALQEWVDLRALSAPGAPWLADVAQRIQAAAGALGIDPATLAPSPDVAALAAGQLPAPDAETVKAAGEMSAEEQDAMIRGMVEGLAARLETNPDDKQGWLRLARAYEVLGETDKAAEARARAAALE